MTPKAIRQAICGWVVTVFLIVTFLLVWCHWESPTQKESSAHPKHRRGTIPPINTCSEQKTYTYGIQLCAPSNQTTIVTIPMTSLTKKGENGVRYSSNYWYVTNDMQNKSCSTLMADYDNKCVDWSTTTSAKYQQNKVLNDQHPGKEKIMPISTQSAYLGEYQTSTK